VTTVYTVTVSNGNGCSSSCSTTVTVAPPPPCSIGAVNPANIICNSGNYTITTPLSTSLYNLSWAITVDGNPAGWNIVGSNTLQTITFSSGNCGAPGFEVHFTLTVVDQATGCTSTCSASFAPGAPLCIVDIRPPVMMNCTATSQYLLASYQTDIVNPVFNWTRNNVSIGAGINDGNGLDSILITQSGTYRFTITDPQNSSNTCFGEVVVNQNNNVPVCSITPPVATQCESTGNTLSAVITSPDPVTMAWSSSNPTWVITSSNTVNPITYTAGTGSTTWMLVVTNTVSGCSDTCMVSDSCQNPFFGCTLGFWKNHPTIWNEASDPISSCIASAIGSLGNPYSGNGTSSASFASTFGLTSSQMSAAGYSTTLTLMEALNLGGGGFQMLARQGVASLLNTCAFPSNFPYTTAQVLTDMHNAIVNNAAASQGNIFASANEAQPEGCPPAGPAQPGSRFGDSGNGLVDLKAYPNPFNKVTTLEFTISYSSHATLELYSPTGAIVKVLFDGTTQPDVTYRFDFDGELYPPGVYFYKLQFGDNIYYERLTLIK